MNLLFDLDGTLTDPALGITRCIAHACQTLGVVAPPARELHRYIGPPLQGSFRSLLQTDDPLRVDAAIAAYRERFATVGMYENELYAGIAETLQALRHASHRLFVATSKPQVYANPIIDHFGLRPHFVKVYGAELDGTRSNKGELLRHLLVTEQIEPDSALMIGDREHDVFGARAVGVRAIAVSWGYGSAAELQAAKPLARVDTLAQLLEVIAAQAG